MHGQSVLPAADLLGFLTLGLLGGFGHCVGMCSPFVLFVSRRTWRGRLRAGEAGRPWRERRFSRPRRRAGTRPGASPPMPSSAPLPAPLGGVVELAGALLGLQRAALVVAGGVLVIWALVRAVGPRCPGSGAGGGALRPRGRRS